MLKPQPSSIQCQRVATLLDVQQRPDGGDSATVLLLRPDQMRFWSRSAALRGADRLLASAVFSHPDSGPRQPGGKSK
ncbi:hypothetical protein [Bradyrhizobium australafricanum]|uniref:hypothetical protein n=1 Tax=Bradyrhizobium australafricanum TaxID=2821406 RepID=UPI001CE2A390|nr:hypothetical protein [Bradyrhizobium australafricanum]MCA6104921.1 hypothetical protein [Bradyrhizobium australafricanum]